MRLLVGVLLISFLTGCGGGSGGTADIPAKVNTAPDLIGPLSLQLTTHSTGETNLAIKDAENDPLTISYSNKPAWVEGVFGNGQLKLTAKPNFFHVGSHQFSLRISDGKLHSDYTLTFNVSDDPTKWQQINTEKAEFIGQWSLSTGNDLHLYDNNKGRFFTRDGGVFDLTWLEKNGHIEFNSTQINCAINCSAYIEIFVVATDGPRKRLVLIYDGKEQAMTAVPYTAKTIKSGIYTTHHHAVDFVNAINANAAEIYLPIELKVDGSSVLDWAKVNTPLMADGKLQPLPNFYQTDISVMRRTDLSQQQLDFNISLTSAEILPSAKHRLTLKYQLSYSLKDNRLNPNDFIGVAELLATPSVGFIELGFTEQMDVPQFTLNSPYISAFRLSTTIDGQLIEMGATELVFTDNTQGIARFNTPQTFVPVERNFSWTIDQQQLVLTLEGKQSRFSFIRHPVNGVSLVTENRLYYPFMTRYKKYDAIALMGNFLAEQSFVQDINYYHNIFPDTTASLFSAELDMNGAGSSAYKWQQESDGSITFLKSNRCNSSATFAVCEADLQRRFANGENLSISYRNFKVIQQTEKQTFVQSALSVKDQTGSQNLESVMRFINIK